MENIKEILWTKYQQAHYVYKNVAFDEAKFDSLFIGAFPSLKEFFRNQWEKKGAVLTPEIVDALDVRKALKKELPNIVVIAFSPCIIELARRRYDDDEDFEITEDRSESPIENSIVFVFRKPSR